MVEERGTCVTLEEHLNTTHSQQKEFLLHRAGYTFAVTVKQGRIVGRDDERSLQMKTFTMQDMI
jgi:hypothetical protein